jgi:hypothetical protein
MMNCRTCILRTLRWVMSLAVVATVSLHGSGDGKRACDGSAIAEVGGGYFLNASDEDNVIRLYRRGKAADPVQEFVLNDFLKPDRNKRGYFKEVDIESVARLGSHLFWIGSHSNDKSGDREVSRDRLFATSLTGEGDAARLTPVGQPFSRLHDYFGKLPGDLGAILKAAVAKRPQAGGINIEGLAAATGDQLLIGFRSPLLDGRALVLRLLNPAQVVKGGAEPAFGEPLWLPLGGLGIRALEPKRGVKSVNEYWLIAGPVDDKGQTRLYEWTVGQAPKLASKHQLDETLGPAEGLAIDTAGRLLVAFDRGDIGASACKDEAIDQRSFTVAVVGERNR